MISYIVSSHRRIILKMVTTRSGKPLIPSSKGVGSKLRGKASVPIVIFEEPVNTENKKRESPCKSTVSEMKKCKTHSTLIDKENVLNTNVIQPSSLLSEPKKIQISQDEKMMSGAPEGDLFDMVVFEDSELWPYASELEAREEFVKGCKIHEKSSVWADLYESVVVIRRVVLHHAEILNTNKTMLLEASKAVIVGVESLRSCRVRSGIMGLRTLLRNCGATLSTMRTPENDICAAVVTSLLTKTGGGPKFISELALNSLLQEAVVGVPPLELIRCLFPSIAHRNPEIGASAIYASVECIRKLEHAVLSDASAEGVEVMRESIQGLALALNAKRPKAKECAKTALRALHAAVGDAHFENLLKAHTNESQQSEVTRAVTTSSTPSTPFTPSLATTATSSSAGASRFGSGMPGSSSVMKPMSMSTASKFVRKPLLPPASASATVAGSASVSRFKLHMMHSAAAATSTNTDVCVGSVVKNDISDISDISVDIVCTAATPARPAPVVVDVPASAPFSSTTCDSVVVSFSIATSASAATPVAALSMREHIQLMKKQQRLAQQLATPVAHPASTSVETGVSSRGIDCAVLVLETARKLPCVQQQEKMEEKMVEGAAGEENTM